MFNNTTYIDNGQGLTIQNFLAQEKVSRDTIDVKRIYIDMAGDLIAGILLSQIIYWYLPAKDGNSRYKLKVHKEGSKWLAKRREDWWSECRIKPREYDRAIKILKDKGIVKTKLFKFNARPTVHIQIDWTVFLPLYQELLLQENNSHLTNPLNGYYESVKSITENTNKDYNITNKCTDFEKLKSMQAKNLLEEKTVVGVERENRFNNQEEPFVQIISTDKEWYRIHPNTEVLDMLSVDKEIRSFIEMYMDTFKQNFKYEHPPLKKKQWEDIIPKIKIHFKYYGDQLPIMTDEYFRLCKNGSLNNGTCDGHIQHFASTDLNKKVNLLGLLQIATM